MKALKFIKIFDVQDAQISYRKALDEETDKLLIIAEIMIDYDGMYIRPSLKMGYDDEQNRDTDFEKIDIEIAKEQFTALFEEVKSMVENFEKEN